MAWVPHDCRRFGVTISDVTDARIDEPDRNRLFSAVEILQDDVVSGWIVAEDDPHRPRRVKVRVDGRLIADVLAADLMDHRTLDLDPDFLGAAATELTRRPRLPAGFHVRIPSVFRAGESHSVSVEADGLSLYEGEATLLEDTSATIRHHFGVRGQWQITEMTVAANRLKLTGWVSPATASLDGLKLTVNGEEVACTLAPAGAEDVERFGFGKVLFSFWPGRVFGMWTVEVPVGAGTDYRVAWSAPSGGTRFETATDLVLPASWFERLQTQPAPPLHLIERTGSRSEAHWRFSAVNFVQRLDDLVHQHTGRQLGDLPNVLDWGCGNGRLSQWLDEIGAGVTGVDIDEDGIAWCREHLPGHFEVIPLNPPTQLAADKFDLIIGSSVMTHLTEEDQLGWLDELRRIARPGGLIALTTMGWLGFQNCPAPWIREAGRQIRDRGMSDAHIPSRLADVVGADSAYYRNTFTPERYVRDHWGRGMEIVTIEPGFNGDRQDLVLLRRI